MAVVRQGYAAMHNIIVRNGKELLFLKIATAETGMKTCLFQGFPVVCREGCWAYSQAVGQDPTEPKGLHLLAES